MHSYDASHVVLVELIDPGLAVVVEHQDGRDHFGVLLTLAASSGMSLWVSTRSWGRSQEGQNNTETDVCLISRWETECCEKDVS